MNEKWLDVMEFKGSNRGTALFINTPKNVIDTSTKLSPATIKN